MFAPPDPLTALPTVIVHKMVFLRENLSLSHFADDHHLEYELGQLLAQ
jgi:hypothetical protein